MANVTQPVPGNAVDQRSSSSTAAPDGTVGAQAGVSMPPVVLEVQDEEVYIPPCKYYAYYFVLFLAYWFGGGKGLDADGDGDFDPTDVKAYILGGNNKNLNPWVEKRKAREKPSDNDRTTIKTMSQLNAMAEEIQRQKDSIRSSCQVAEDGRGLALGNIAEMDVIDPQGTERAESVVDEAVAEIVEGTNYVEDVYRQSIPFFCIVMSMVLLFLWTSGKNFSSGWDDIFEFARTRGGLDVWIGVHTTDLNLWGSHCEDYRAEIYRWWTYQFTHMSLSHVFTNCFLICVIGIPFEGNQGSLRTFLVFELGVVGGALCFIVSDAHHYVVGASGGVYSLLLVHMADLAMNWREKKFKTMIFGMVALLLLVDLLCYNFSTDSAAKVSHSAHFGGAITGFILGVLILRNDKVRLHERVFWWFCLVLGVSLTIFAIAWLITMDDGSSNIFSSMSDEPPACFIIKIFNYTWYTDYKEKKKWECIGCHTKTCMDLYMEQKYKSAANLDQCGSSLNWWYREP